MVVPAVIAPHALSPLRADTHDLLCAYRAALDLAADPPASRASRVALLTPVVNLGRPTWGLQRFLVEHIRQRLDALTRRYSLRLALGQDDGDDAQDREASSGSRRRSRLRRPGSWRCSRCCSSSRCRRS